LSPSLLLMLHPPTPALSTLSLHDALPILVVVSVRDGDRHRGDSIDPQGAVRSGLDRRRQLACQASLRHVAASHPHARQHSLARQDRKSTRLNSSHVAISYAVFCLKKEIRD